VGNESNKGAAWILAVLIGSGGTAATLPKVAPSWYRPDPARGTELREMRADIDRLRTDFHEFLKEGPREVRANQDRMINQLDLIIREVSQINHRQN
jgi:hypothetical protein